MDKDEGFVKGIVQATAILLTASTSLAEASPAGFQGIPWGASEQAIRGRFGNDLRKNPCDVPREAEIYAESGEVCDFPILEPYEVAGIPFRLSFNLSGQRALKRVSLYYRGPLVGDSAPASEQSNVRRKFQRLKALLAEQYGEPEKVDGALSPMVLLTARWRVPGTIIVLEAQGSTIGKGYEGFQITYRSLAHSDSAKL